MRPRPFLLAAALAAAVLVVAVVAPLRAAPDLTVSVGLDGSTLHGGTTGGSFTISNASGENGFNLSLTLTTPEGVTLAGSDLPATASYQDPTTLETTYFFENVSDAPDGATVTFGFSLAHDDTVWIVGESFTVDGAGFVSADPRFVPDFDDTTGTVTGDFDGTGVGSGSTTIVPFTVTKSIAAPEGELLRGVHDHQTTATITIENADAGATESVTIVDVLDAGLEFLACGVDDNSQFRVEEYPSSGPIPNLGPQAGCLDPDTVETVVNPGGFPPGTYTRVTWTLTDLGAGETRTLTYRLAIPLRENTTSWDAAGGPGTGTAPTPASLAQAANLDNNNGDLTTETDPETSLGNVAAVTGTYQGATLTPGTPLTVEGSAGVAAEDLRIRKSASTGTSVIGTQTTWTVTVETSEYVTDATALTLTDLVPSGLCPGADPAVCGFTAAPTPVYDAGFPADNGDGTYTLRWTLADLGTNDTTTVSYRTEQDAQFGSGEPIEIGQSWSNQASISGTTETIDGDGGTTSQSVGDESSDSQSTPRLTFDKEVAVPATGDACGDGSALDWAAGAPTVGAGDRVCWRITVQAPDVRSRNVTITDLLPLGFAYESAQPGAGNDDLALLPITDFDDGASADGVLVWRLGAAPDFILPPGVTFEWVISTVAEDPNDYEIADLVGNLLKITAENGTGDFFFDREDIEVIWGRPELSLVKTVDGTDADTPGTAVEAVAGDTVTYAVTITNDGNVAAVDVDVRDILPDWPGGGCAAVGAIPDAGTCADEGGTDVIQWDALGPIAPGDSLTLTYDLTVPDGVSPEEVFRNDAGVERYFADTTAGTRFEYIPEDNLDPGAGTPNAPAADDPAHVRGPAAVVVKPHTTGIDTATNAGVGEATVGEGVTFTARVTIPAGTTVYGAEILDNLTEAFEYGSLESFNLNGVENPPGFTFTPDGNGNGLLGDLQVGFPDPFEVPAGGPDAVVELRFLATVADVPSVARGGTILNAVNFLWEDSQENNFTEVAVASLTVVEPSVRVRKQADDPDGQVEAGQVVRYELRVRNRNLPSATTAFDTVLTDTLPDGLFCADLELADPDGDPTTLDPDSCVDGADSATLTWDLGTIEPGGANDVFAVYDATFPDPLVVGTTFTNVAEVATTSLPGPSPQERTGASDCGPAIGFQPCTDYLDTDAETLTVPGALIAKQVQGPDDPTSGPSTEQTIGEPVRFFIEATIPADVVGFDVIVIDRLPPGIRTASATGYTVSATCLNCDGGTNPDIEITELPATANRVGWALTDGLDVPAVDARVVAIVFDAVVLDEPGNADGVVRTNRVQTVGNTEPRLPAFPPPGVPTPGGFDVSTDVAAADVVIREPDVVVDKQVFEAGAPAPDDRRRAIEAFDLQYRLVVTNQGQWPAYDVAVTDTITIPSGNAMGCVFGLPECVYDPVVLPLPPGVTALDVDPADGSLAFEVDELEPGQTVQIIYGLKVWSPATTADEDPLGPEILNVGSVDRYVGVPDFEADNREYVGNDDDTEVELDLATVGDLVWFDVNGDGVRQVLVEPPLAGVVVTVDYLDGDLVTIDDSDTTDGSILGNWLVDDLPGGTFTISVDPATLPGWATPSYDLDGIGTPNQWTGVIAEDGDPRDVDFGYTGTGTLGDTIFWDLDGDGAQDPDEPGFPGVRVDLVWAGFDGDIATPTDNVDYSAVTDANGVWLAEDLPGGLFSIAVVTSDLPVGVDNTADPDGGLDSQAFVVLGDGATDLDQDFGYRGRGELGDLVWLDLDRSGTATPDPGEPGLADVDLAVTWFGDDGVLGGGDDVAFTRTTDVDGLWLAPGLVGGGYQVTVDAATLPPGLDPTYDPDGTPDGTTDVTLADADDANLDVDFSFGGNGEIGDTVWWDLDGDGTQDPGEPGIPGVDVLIRWAGPNGAFDDGVGTDDVTYLETTDAAGGYGRDRLPGGLFRVTVTDPFGTSLPSIGVPTFDLDGIGTPHEAELTLGLGEANLGVDFGYRGDNALGDLVWFDVDDSGVQEPPEPGLDGIDLDLVWAGLDGVVGTADDLALATTTAGGGAYGFDGLFSGLHRVTVDEAGLPTGLAASYDLDGGNDSTTDLDLPGGADLDTVDFGYRGSAAVGDLLWLDLDADGAFGPADVGIPDVDMLVTWPGPDDTLDTADDVTFVASTSAAGIYGRNGLPPGVPIRVSVDTADPGFPAGVTPSFDPDGGDDDRSEVVLALGESNLDQDFGYAGSASLGDRVWLDLDRDGVQQPDEPGLVGVDVGVTWAGGDGAFGTADDVGLAATTGADGGWGIDRLPAGRFRVAMADPGADLVPTYDLDDGTTGPDGTAELVLGDGEARDDADVGYAGPHEVGDLVWFDVDDSGSLDGDEVGLDGLDVTLVWDGLDGTAGTADDVTLTTTSAAGGLYGFAGLPSGDVVVSVDEAGLPTGLAASYDLDGGNDSATSLTLGPSNLDVDFGYRGDAEIGEVVFLDTDADFQRDPFDPGLPGVDMLVTWPGPDGALDTADDVVFVETTDADGQYLRDGLPGGVTYRVMVDETTTPPGTAQTFDPDGPPGPLVPRDGMTEVDLAPGESFLDANFGYAGQATIGDRIWWDVDGDGTDDVGEPGIPGIEVQVTWDGVDGIFGTPDDVPLLPVFTGADGAWSVVAVAAGNYEVVVVDRPVDLVPTFDFDGVATPDMSATTIAPSTDDLDQDFGYTGTAGLGDLVWVDVDGDGVVDPGEPPIPGAGVTLTWAGVDGLLDTADDVALPEVVTDADGLYGFTGLPAGTFRVAVTSGIPDGLVPVFDLDGSDDAVAEVALAEGEARDDVDFGYLGAGVLGDLVWWDVDGDGTADPGEPGFPGVGVTVTWAGLDGTPGTADDVAYAATTDPAGQWTVDRLPAGPFVVAVDRASLPGGLVATFDPDGGDDDTAVVDLAPAEANLDQDFGYVGTLAIGDLVWRDTNRNGVYDADEEALAGVGVEVTFLGADGVLGGGDDVTFRYETAVGPAGAVPLAAIPRPGDPQYLAGGLVAGSYVVALDVASLPEGSEPLSDLDGGDAATTEVALVDADILDADFGVFLNDPPEVSDRTATAACGRDLFVDPLAGVTDPNGDEVTLVVDSIVAPDGVDVTVEADGRLRIAVGSSVTEPVTVAWEVADARGARSAVELVVEVDCLDVEVSAQCTADDVSELTWAITGTGSPAEAPVTITWLDADGIVRATSTDQPLAGTIAFPGYVDGGFDEAFSWVLDGVAVTFEAANGPVVGPFEVDVPCDRLPQTGTDAAAPFAWGVGLTLLGGALVLLTRRRDRTQGSDPR